MHTDSGGASLDAGPDKFDANSLGLETQQVASPPYQGLEDGARLAFTIS